MFHYVSKYLYVSNDIQCFQTTELLESNPPQLMVSLRSILDMQYPQTKPASQYPWLQTFLCNIREKILESERAA